MKTKIKQSVKKTSARPSCSLATFFRRHADFVRKLKKSFAASLLLTLAFAGVALIEGGSSSSLLRASVDVSVDSGTPMSLIPAIGRGALTGGDATGCANLAQHFRDGGFEVYDLPCYVQYLSETLLYFAGGLAVLFIMIGGYKYLSGGIDEGGKEAGKKTITYALAGLTISVLAWTIVNTWQVFLTSGDQLGGGTTATGQAPDEAMKSVAPTGADITLKCPNGNEIDAVMAYIASNEGVKNDKYTIGGRPTIGVGHDCVAFPSSEACTSGNTISDALVRSTFATDFADHKNAAASKVPGFSALDSARQAVLIDLTFNQGPGWYKNWPKMIGALSANPPNYDEAYKQISLNKDGTGPSAYLTQVGDRAKTNASILKNGDPEIIKKKAGSDKDAMRMLCGG